MTVAAIPLLGLQSQKGSHVPAMLEPLRILECQNVGQRDQRPYAVDLRQQFLLRVPLGNFLNLLVVFGDLLADRPHTLQQGSDPVLAASLSPSLRFSFT